jgi:hypothetical protein
MPIHDWKRVSAGTWHLFHLAWIAEIQDRLHGGCLPPDYYALAEQIVGPFGPDGLTLQETPYEEWTSSTDDRAYQGLQKSGSRVLESAASPS